MLHPTPGLHHVTAICGSPQNNLDFYGGVLGLRLVKKTVNFDDPGTFHFYYGDGAGSPGTILTFFPWPGQTRGRVGGAMVQSTAFAAPTGAIDWWMDRLAHHAYEFVSPRERFGGRVLPVHDPDGLQMEIVERDDLVLEEGGASGPIPHEYALRGFDGVTLSSLEPDATAAVLRDVFGYEEHGEAEGALRLVAAAGTHGRRVDIVGGREASRSGVGTVHHIAFRARDDDEQQAVRERLLGRGLHVTDVRDRQYFRSIYFREPGGVLFEVATDQPGFTLDEEMDRLGTGLQLPPWLEPRRAEIERRLPEVSTSPAIWK